MKKILWILTLAASVMACTLEGAGTHSGSDEKPDSGENKDEDKGVSVGTLSMEFSEDNTFVFKGTKDIKNADVIAKGVFYYGYEDVFPAKPTPQELAEKGNLLDNAILLTSSSPAEFSAEFKPTKWGSWYVVAALIAGDEVVLAGNVLYYELIVPSVEDPLNLTSRSVTLKGSVPNAMEGASYGFMLAPDPALPIWGSQGAIPLGATTVSDDGQFSVEWTHLDPATLYTYTAFTMRKNVTKYSEKKFFISPNELSVTASDVTSKTAKLNATIYVYKLSEAAVKFYYSSNPYSITDENYATNAILLTGHTSGYDATKFYADITQVPGLSPSTKYYYRAVLTAKSNSQKITIVSDIHSFTTLAE